MTDYNKAYECLHTLKQILGDSASFELASLKQIIAEQQDMYNEEVFDKITDDFKTKYPEVDIHTSYEQIDTPNLITEEWVPTYLEVKVADMYVAKFLLSRDEIAYRSFLKHLEDIHHLQQPDSSLSAPSPVQEVTKITQVDDATIAQARPTVESSHVDVPRNEESKPSVQDDVPELESEEKRIAENIRVLSERRQQIQAETKLKNEQANRDRVEPIFKEFDRIKPAVMQGLITLRTLFDSDTKQTLSYIRQQCRCFFATRDWAYADALIEIELNNREVRLENVTPYIQEPVDPENEYTSPLVDHLVRETILYLNLKYNVFIAEQAVVHEVTDAELLITFINYCDKNGTLDISRYPDEVVNLSNTTYNLFATKAFNVDAMNALDVNNPYDAYQPTWFKTHPAIQLYTAQLRAYAQRVPMESIGLMTGLIAARDQHMTQHRLDPIASRQLNEIAKDTKAKVVMTPDFTMINTSYEMGIGEDSVKYVRLFFTEDAVLSLLDKEGSLAQTFYTPENCVSLLKVLSYAVYKIRKDNQGENNE